MDGVGGVKGWRWLFILEGLLTIGVSILCFWTLPDFPEIVGWLTREERDFIQAKLEKDTGKSAHGQAITWRDVLDVLKDCKLCAWFWKRLINYFFVVKILLGGLAYFGLIVPAYGNSSTILTGL